MNDKDVAKLLADNKKIIIPGLGMFMSSEYSGKHTVMFNPYLQINDGVLVKYLTETYGQTEADALNSVETYITNLKEKAAQSGYKIEGVGGLSSKGDGALSFTQADGGEVSSAPTREESPQAIDPHVEMPKMEVASEEIAQETTEEKVEQEVKPEPFKVKFEIPAPAPEAKPEEVKEKTDNTPLPDEKKLTKEEKSDIEALKKGAEKLAKEPKKKKKKLVLILFLLVVFGGGGTLAFLYFDEIKAFISPEEVVADITPQEDTTEDAAPEVVEENIEEEEESVEITEEEVEEAIVQSLKQQTAPTVNKASGAQNLYHVVAGSFSVEENAINLVTQLNQKGYNAQLLGKFGSLYQVSAGSVGDKQGANEIAKKLKESEGMDSWVKFW